MKMNAKSVRTVRKVERPRPLKLNVESEKTTSVNTDVTKKPITDVMNDLQALYISLSNCNYDENTASEISRVCDTLKTRGPELDLTNRSLMDHYFVTFRNASREDRLDMVSRLKLLEVIELKAMKWLTNENITSYYKRKIIELEGEKAPVLTSPSIVQSYSFLPNQSTQVCSTAAGVPLAPGEILRSSGKFTKPTKIAGKNYYKDEVIIRNSDSGKVMGIKGRRVHMIEELSDTIISFQRVNPGVRDRLVQITGPNEEAISHAKTLVEDTIRRNASPLREKVDSIDTTDCPKLTTLIDFDDVQEFSSKKQIAHSLSMSDASSGEYSYKINVGADTITLTGENATLLKMAKFALQAYFSGQVDINEKEPILPPIIHAEEQLNDDSELKNRLERSSSWMSSVGSRASLSPLDTSSEDEISKDLPQIIQDAKLQYAVSDVVVPNAKSNSSQIRRPSSFSSDTEVGIPGEGLVAEKVDSTAFFPISHSLLSTGHFEVESEPAILPPEPRRKIVYTREDLLKFSKSPLCKHKGLQLSTEVINAYPFIIRENSANHECRMNLES